MSVKQIVKNLKKARADYRQVIKAGVIATANEVRNDVVKSIQRQSSGSVVTAYKQGGGSYRRVVSKEGEAPNVDTGRLVQSIAVEMAGNAYKTAHVGTGDKKAPFLEFGTKDMKPRPFLYPALERMRQSSGLEKNIAKAARVI